MNLSIHPFAATYAEARAKFLAAAATADTLLESHPAPETGAEGEALAMDIARLGSDDAEALLIVSSGCHGVEGYCGSGIQIALLSDPAFLARAREAGTALLFVHALNPWGFSHGRRVTQEGVDLNRNFVDFARPLPVNPGYDKLAGVLLPRAWPPGPTVELRLMGYAVTRGMVALQQAISGGQYAHPDGLFYGGAAPTWSHLALRRVLRRHAARCRHLGWIDLHTGLGPNGVGERIFSSRDDGQSLKRARAWWGADVTQPGDGKSTSAQVLGNAWETAYEECPQAVYTGVTLEFGTVRPTSVLQALRLDHWVAREHPRQREPLPALREAARRAMREAFFTDTPAWRAAVLAQGREVATQAIAGLAGRRA